MLIGIKMNDPGPRRRFRRLEGAARRFPRSTASPRKGWVRATREALGMSQAQLAARIGVSRATVQKLELAEARRRITLESLDRLAAALGCELAVALLPTGGSLEAVRAKAASEKAEAMLAPTDDRTTSPAGEIADGAMRMTIDATTDESLQFVNEIVAAEAQPSRVNTSALRQQLAEELLRGSPRKLWRTEAPPKRAPSPPLRRPAAAKARRR